MSDIKRIEDVICADCGNDNLEYGYASINLYNMIVNFRLKCLDFGLRMTER